MKKRLSKKAQIEHLEESFRIFMEGYDRLLNWYNERNAEYNDYVGADIKTRIARVFNPRYRE